MKDTACTVCYDYQLDDLIYRMKVEISELSQEAVKSLHYGYSCDKKAEQKIRTLQSYLKQLESEYYNLAQGGKPCLEDYRMQMLAERIRKLTPSCSLSERQDVIIDESGENAWIADNPTCVSRQKWEKLAATVATCLNLIVESVPFDKKCEIVMTMDDACQLTFELVKELIPCDVIMAIYVHKTACELNMKITRTLEECKLDYELLLEQVDCDLTLNDYYRLVECNISFDVAKAILTNGCAINVNDAGDVVVVTPMGEYPMDTFNFAGVPDVEVLKTLGADTSNSEYLKNPKRFIDNLNQDYE